MHFLFHLTILLSLSYFQAEVIQLTQAIFQETITSNSYVFVKFYAPWCGHCKALAPKFESLSNNFPQEKEIKFAEIDASNEREINMKYQISGYPTLKLFIDGEALNYEGGREENDMKEWILKKMQPSVKEAELSELDQIKKDNQVVVILYDESKQNTFEFAARQFDEIPFYLIKSSESPAPLVLYKQFDEGQNIFTDASQLNKENIINFVGDNQYPKLMEFSDKVTKRILDNGKLALVAFIKDQEPELENIMNQAKEELTNKGLILSIAKWSDDSAKKVGERTGVVESQLPVIRLLKSKGRDIAKYALEEYFEEINLNNIYSFVQDFQDGKVKEYYKSEPIPETQGDVIKVVGKTFQQIVMDREKDVLVKYYAPWCGHCKALAPIWESIAKQLKRNKDLIIAEFDYTANEVEGEGLPEVTSYPTIKFHTRKRKIGAIDFKGERNEEAILDFLKKRASVPWKEPKSKPKKSEEL